MLAAQRVCMEHHWVVRCRVGLEKTLGLGDVAAFCVASPAALLLAWPQSFPFPPLSLPFETETQAKDLSSHRHRVRSGGPAGGTRPGQAIPSVRRPQTHHLRSGRQSWKGAGLRGAGVEEWGRTFPSRSGLLAPGSGQGHLPLTSPSPGHPRACQGPPARGLAILKNEIKMDHKTATDPLLTRTFSLSWVEVELGTKLNHSLYLLS